MPSRRIVRTKRILEGRHALGVVAGACGVAFGLGALIRYSVLQAFDLRATRAIQKAHQPVVDTAMVAFTTVGEPLVVPVLGILAAVSLRAIGLPRAAKFVLASTVSVPLNVGMKTLWDRERPDRKLVSVAVETSGTSFPSGHTMGAVSLYGAMAALAWIHLEARPTRVPVMLLLAALPVGCGISRVYLGAHWLSDVVAGAALGLLILIPLARRYIKAIPAEVEEQAALEHEPSSLSAPVRALTA